MAAVSKLVHSWHVNWLIQQDEKYFSLLYSAARRGFLQIAEKLVATANVNQQCFEGKTPLIIAAINGHVSIVKLLLKQPRINVLLCDDFRKTPLHYAIESGHSKIVQLLKKANATLESSDEQSEKRIEVLIKNVH